MVFQAETGGGAGSGGGSSRRMGGQPGADQFVMKIPNNKVDSALEIEIFIVRCVLLCNPTNYSRLVW